MWPGHLHFGFVRRSSRRYSVVPIPVPAVVSVIVTTAVVYWNPFSTRAGRLIFCFYQGSPAVVMQERHKRPECACARVRVNNVAHDVLSLELCNLRPEGVQVQHLVAVRPSLVVGAEQALRQVKPQLWRQRSGHVAGRLQCGGDLIWR